MDLRDQLQQLYDANQRLTPALVLAEARDPDSPLHPLFEWNNDEAAERWRLHQARELIRSVRVVYKPATGTDPARSVRAWHAIRDEAGHHYEPAEQVALNPFQRRLLMADMEREWLQLQRRWSHFDEFWRLITATNERRAG
jgi:hypothetical protein